MKLLQSSLYIVLAMLLFSSCAKNDLIDAEKEEVKPFVLEPFDGLLATALPADECFTFSYPIRFAMPDGSTLILDGEDDTALKDWYEANVESEQRPELIYPVQVYLDDELIPIYNNEELKRIKNYCEDKWEYRKDCFEFIYPVSFLMPDGTTVSLNDEEDAGLKDWYEANPDSDERPSVVYPVEVKFKEEIISLSSDDELDRVKDACDDFRAESAEEICFNFVFPLSIVVGDIVLTGDSIEELRQAMKDWYDGNPDSEIKPEFVYPLDIIFEDGTIEQIENEEALDAAKRNC